MSTSLTIGAPSGTIAPSPAAVQSRRTRAIEQSSLLLPLIGIGVGAWAVLRGERQTRSLGLAALVASLSASLTRWQMARWVTEKARYRVESSDGDFEVRHYASRIQAETVINAAPWERSLNDGFHRLAGYIFGDNGGHQKIAMTAPVTMTLGAVDRSTRTVAFKMPDSYPLETLPEPNDRRITLRRIPARRIAVLTFSGRYGKELPNRKRMELLTRVRNARLLPIGDVTFAGYDAPWTLPLLRRNEVLVEVSSLPNTSTT
ncbi:MAG: heme-binding protein [Polyangiaceae bacterium]